MNRVAPALLAAAFLAGCASPKDWRYSEVTSAIERFKQAQPSNGPKLPQRVRSVYIDGPDSLRVYLSDDVGFTGHGYELDLKKLPSGTWADVNYRSFGY